MASYAGVLKGSPLTPPVACEQAPRLSEEAYPNGEPAHWEGVKRDLWKRLRRRLIEHGLFNIREWFKSSSDDIKTLKSLEI